MLRSDQRRDRVLVRSPSGGACTLVLGCDGSLFACESSIPTDESAFMRVAMERIERHDAAGVVGSLLILFGLDGPSPRWLARMAERRADDPLIARRFRAGRLATR